MELQAQKDSIYIKKRIGKKTKKVIIEKDYILPDNKEDFIRHETESLITYTKRREILENKIKIDGGINLKIIYLIPEEKNRVLNLTEEYSEILEFEKINQEDIISELTRVNNIDISIINERKIHYKIELEITITIYKKEKIEIINNIEKTEKIELLKNKINIMTYLDYKESKVTLKEKMTLENINEKIQILKIIPKINNIETKISYNKILIKADCTIKCIYQIESGIIYIQKKEIPVMGFLDVENVKEESICKIEIPLKNINIIENANEIDINLEYNILGNIYESRQIELISDLYAIGNDVNIQKEEIYIDILDSKLNNYEFEEKSIIEDINQLYDCQYKIKDIEKENDKIKIKIEAMYLYSSFENQLINQKKNILKLEINSEQELKKDELTIEENESILLPDSSIQSKLKLKLLTSQTEKIELIKDIQLEPKENKEEYNMIIYLFKKGDNLWKIAKKFQSTISKIQKINNIEDEKKIKIGDKLYIPRSI